MDIDSTMLAIRANSNGRLAGKVAVVTGAGFNSKDGVGIGAAIGIRFAQEGARVVVVDRDAAAAETTVAAIHECGGLAIKAMADLGKSADCQRAVQEAVAAYERVDILVNNAATSRPGSIRDVTDENWDMVMGVNLKGTMVMTRSVIPHMGRGGSIVNISSRSALRPSTSGVAYGVSKGAIITLTQVAAFQIASLGIRVNCVVPGGPWTPMAQRVLAHGMSDDEVARLRERLRLAVPLQMEGTSWELADPTLFFASNDSRWVTGEVLVVDGGSVLCRAAETGQGTDATHAAFEPRAGKGG